MESTGSVPCYPSVLGPQGVPPSLTFWRTDFMGAGGKVHVQCKSMQHMQEGSGWKRGEAGSLGPGAVHCHSRKGLTGRGLQVPSLHSTPFIGS